MKTPLINLFLIGFVAAQSSDSTIPWPARPQTQKAKPEATAQQKPSREGESKRVPQPRPAPRLAPEEEALPDRIEPGWSNGRYDRVIVALKKAKEVRKSRIDLAEAIYKAEFKKFTDLGDWQKHSKEEMIQRRDFFAQDAKRLAAEIQDLKKNIQDLESGSGESASIQKAKARLLEILNAKEQNHAVMAQGCAEAEAAIADAERGAVKSGHMATLLQAYLERVSLERLLWDTIYDGQIQLAREYQLDDSQIKPPSEMLKERTK